MNDVVSTIPKEDIVTPAERMLQAARAMVVDSPAMLDVAAGELRSIKARSKQLEDERLAMTRPLDETKRRIMEKYRTPLDYLASAEAAIKNAVGGYQRKVADERRLAQQRADDEARKTREKLEREAQAARDKAAREAEELRQKATAAANAGRQAEAEKLAARAESKVEAADLRAGSLEQAAAAVPTSVMLPAAPKAQGVHTTKRYTARVTDKAKLVAFVAATPMFLHLLDEDQSALDAQARALKDQFAIPGCELVVVDGVSARAA